MSYKTKYIPNNVNKCVGSWSIQGDKKFLFTRSLWERFFAKYLDECSSVEYWGFECLSIKYYDSSSKKWRLYYPDFMFRINNKTYVIEIKPQYQTVEKRIDEYCHWKKRKRQINEFLTYNTNKSKWQYANAYCKNKGYIFQVWSEIELRKIGAKI